MRVRFPSNSPFEFQGALQVGEDTVNILYAGSNPAFGANLECTGSSVWTEHRATNASFARVQILLGVPFIVR
jgi:hypothetical protein